MSLGCVVTEQDTATQYVVELQTEEFKVVTIVAYGLEVITSPVVPFDLDIIQELFPNRADVQVLQRKAGDVDMLIGHDYLGLHPKREIYNSGDHLSVMEGVFGKCIFGSHPRLQEQTNFITQAGTTWVTSLLSRSKEAQLDRYILGEELATTTTPKCGGCRCGKCPSPGHNFSFKEEQ